MIVRSAARTPAWLEARESHRLHAALRFAGHQEHAPGKLVRLRSDDVDLGGSRVGVRQSIAGFHLELLDHDERVRTVGLDDLYTERLGP